MLNRYWILGLVACLMTTGLTTRTVADDEPVKAAEAPATEEEASPADPFAIPSDASPAELLEFIKAVTSKRMPANSREEFIKNIVAAQTSASEAASQVLAAKDITDEQAVEAAKAKIAALRLLGRVGDKAAGEELDKFVKSMKEDKRPAIAEMMKMQALVVSANSLPTASDEERQAFVKDLNEYLDSKKKLAGEDFMLVMSAGRALEYSKANADAAALYKKIATLAAASNEQKIKDYGKRFDGMARRVDLPGNKMEVFGPLLGGEEINWKDYRGKIVLIDFWATWCGPCIAELPNLKKNYETYHSRGFDVIGVSLDDNKEKLDKFVADREIVWPTIFDAESAGWENPLAQHYGISGIPTAILVDKEGKVVSLNARGEALGELLAEMIGPANETVEDGKPKDAKE